MIHLERVYDIIFQTGILCWISHAFDTGLFTTFYSKLEYYVYLHTCLLGVLPLIYSIKVESLIVYFSMNFHPWRVQKRPALPTLCCAEMQEFNIQVPGLWNFKVSCSFWQNVCLSGILKDTHQEVKGYWEQYIGCSCTKLPKLTATATCSH